MFAHSCVITSPGNISWKYLVHKKKGEKGGTNPIFYLQMVRKVGFAMCHLVLSLPILLETRLSCVQSRQYGTAVQAPISRKPCYLTPLVYINSTLVYRWRQVQYLLPVLAVWKETNLAGLCAPWQISIKKVNLILARRAACLFCACNFLSIEGNSAVAPCA